MSLDKSKLLNVRPAPDGGYTAGCPACGRAGSDSKRIHLRVYPNGKWSCAVHPGDSEHNKAIYAIAGDGTGMVEDAAPVAARQLELPKTWPVDVLDKLIRDHSYWNGRGVSDETVELFRGGVATEGQMKGRYVFPIFDPLNDDKLIGFAGRLIAPVPGLPDLPSWKLIGSKSLFVFGDPDECESSHRVVFVESIGDLLALREHGVRDVLCLFGISLSQVLLAKVIALNPDQIIISTNRDVAKHGHRAGQEGADKIGRTLSKFFEESVITTVFPPDGAGKDWGACDGATIKAAFGVDKA